MSSFTTRQQGSLTIHTITIVNKCEPGSILSKITNMIYQQKSIDRFIVASTPNNELNKYLKLHKLKFAFKEGKVNFNITVTENDIKNDAVLSKQRYILHSNYFMIKGRTKNFYCDYDLFSIEKIEEFITNLKETHHYSSEIVDIKLTINPDFIVKVIVTDKINKFIIRIKPEINVFSGLELQYARLFNAIEEAVTSTEYETKLIDGSVHNGLLFSFGDYNYETESEVRKTLNNRISEIWNRSLIKRCT